VDTRNRLLDMTRFTLTRGKRATLSVLVIGEVALALVLLASSALVLQAFRNVLHEDPGFRAENVLTFNLRLAVAKYPKPENWLPFYTRLVEKLRALPGVTAASVVSIVPLDGHTGYFFTAEHGRKADRKGR
jgi:hypothetical protein